MESSKISFDGNIRDMGSKGKSAMIATIKIKCSGDEDNFIARCRNKFSGKEITNENVAKNKKGELEYTAKIKSYDGI